MHSLILSKARPLKGKLSISWTGPAKKGHLVSLLWKLHINLVGYFSKAVPRKLYSIILPTLLAPY